MKRTIVVKVTREDIDNAVGAFICPIAVALKKQFNFAYIGVGFMSVTIGTDRDTRYPLPDVAKEFIAKHDDLHKDISKYTIYKNWVDKFQELKRDLLSPFSFELEVDEHHLPPQAS